MKKFKVISNKGANGKVNAGDTVYQAAMHDYGLARDDTNATGIEHVSVSLKADGDYPLFTIPARNLQELSQ